MEIIVNKNITNNYFLLLKNLSSYYHIELLFQMNGNVCSILGRIVQSSRFHKGMRKYSGCDPKFPFIMTTYSSAEHWFTCAITRWQSWLTEAQPQVYVEMSEELSQMKGIKSGDKVKVESPGDHSCVWLRTILPVKTFAFKFLLMGLSSFNTIISSGRMQKRTHSPFAL